MKSRRITFFGLALAAAALVAFARPINDYFYIARSLDTFSTLFQELNAYYVDTVDSGPLLKAGIDRMTSWLDPYSAYIPRERVRDFNTQTTGQYAGIGAYVNIANEKVVVMNISRGSPAQRAGLMLGDEIVAVDGVSAKGGSEQEISKQLKGRLGTHLTLLIRRRGMGEKIRMTLTREKIKINDVSHSELLAGDIGYVRLAGFKSGSSIEVQKAIEQLKREGACKLILDLRNNPGGLLHEAINMANLFLPRGEIIVSVRGRVERWNTTYRSLNEPADADIPLVALIDNASASASEVVAGALKDYDRAVLIGDRTFGKGLVQTTTMLPYDTRLKITTAKYYTPSGRCIQVIDYNHQKDSAERATPPFSPAEYKTRRGRTVYEQTGIAPDVTVKDIYFSEVAMQLYTSNRIFNYAALFCTSHPPPSSPKALSFSDADYDKFLRWLVNSEVNITSGTDRQIQSLREAARQDGVYDELSDEIAQLEESTTRSQLSGIAAFKDEIMDLLRGEILFHYGLLDDSRAVDLANQTIVKEAIKVLNDSVQYQQILSGQDP